MKDLYGNPTKDINWFIAIPWVIGLFIVLVPLLIIFAVSEWWKGQSPFGNNQPQKGQPKKWREFKQGMKK